LRHTFATRLLQRGANPREVQELLGHASPTTTATYTHIANRGLHDAVARAWLRHRWTGSTDGVTVDEDI